MDVPLQEVQVGQVGRSGHVAESGGDRGGGVGRHGRRSENNNEARGASSGHNPDIPPIYVKKNQL